MAPAPARRHLDDDSILKGTVGFDMSPVGCLPGTETTAANLIGTTTPFPYGGSNSCGHLGLDNIILAQNKGGGPQAASQRLLSQVEQNVLDESRFYHSPLAGQPPLPAVAQVRVTVPVSPLVIVNVFPLLAPAVAVTT